VLHCDDGTFPIPQPSDDVVVDTLWPHVATWSGMAFTERVRPDEAHLDLAAAEQGLTRRRLGRAEAWESRPL
jgi:hypothetical protein